MLPSLSYLCPNVWFYLLQSNFVLIIIFIVTGTKIKNYSYNATSKNWYDKNKLILLTSRNENTFYKYKNRNLNRISVC